MIPPLRFQPLKFLALLVFSVALAGCGKSGGGSASGGSSGSSPSGVSLLDSSSDPEVRRLGEQGRAYRRGLQDQLDSTNELQQVSSTQTTTLSQCPGQRGASNFQEITRTIADLSAASDVLEADLQNAIEEYDRLERQTRIDSASTVNSTAPEVSERREQILILEISTKEQQLRVLNGQLNAASSGSTASIDAPPSVATAAQTQQFALTNQIYTVSTQLAESRSQLSTLRTNRQNRNRQIEEILSHYRSESASFAATLSAFGQRSSSLRQSILAQQQTISGICPQP